MAIMKSLPVKLTKEEVRTKGERIAELVIDVVDIEDEKKTVTKEYAARLKALGKEIRGLSREVRSGEEEREVECEERIDHGRNVIEIVRMDTGEVVAHRPMEDYDRQRELQEIEGTLDGVANVSKEEPESAFDEDDVTPMDTGLPA